MSFVKAGGTSRRTRHSKRAGRGKPEGHSKPRRPAPPKERPLGPADILATDHPLHGALVGWLQAKSAKLENPLPLTRRQARKFLAAHPAYRKVMVAA